MPELMTVGELGLYLRITKRTVYRLLKRNAIPSMRVGREWRFEKMAIDAWLERSRGGIGARILVIDDDQIIRLLLKETLSERGHFVVEAESSAVGLEYAKRFDFDLVFLDLKMPQMDGAVLLRELRKIKPGLPVTIITGYPDSELMAKALEQGPFGVMNKPFGESDIVAAVDSFLRITRERPKREIAHD